MESPSKKIYLGICLAVLAAFIWSGNFIAARGVIMQIPPVSLAFYRWLTASIILLPFAVKPFKAEWGVVKRSGNYLCWVSLTGVTLFNSFVYVAAHYTTAINLALIGTTTSPVFAIIFAGIFLKEKIGGLKIAGMALCIIGVIYLLSKGSFQNLLSFHFTAGDGWVLLAAFSFAIYTTLVRKKPAGISSFNFLFVISVFGTILLLPAYAWEIMHSADVHWTPDLLLIILYLGAGASVIAFLSWNISIGYLGSGRTALFGNLIPVFSSVEATVILHEPFTMIHIVSMSLVFAGIVVANWRPQ